MSGATGLRVENTQVYSLHMAWFESPLLLSVIPSFDTKFGSKALLSPPPRPPNTSSTVLRGKSDALAHLFTAALNKGGGLCEIGKDRAVTKAISMTLRSPHAVM